MSLNLVDAVKGYFGGDMQGKVANYLGESESVLKKSLDAVIPVSLAGIIKKAEGSPESLLNMARDAYSSGIVNNLSDSFRSGGQGIPASGPSLISGLFGDKFGSIANAVSSFTGAKGSTASSLFGTIIPLALGLLGKHAGENNLSPSGLASLLGSQKNSILSMLPAGLNISNIFSVGNLTNSNSVQEETKKANWFVPLLLALAAIALLWWMMKTCNKPKEAAPATITDTVVPTTPEPVVIERQSVKLKLPDGVELDAYKGGIEDLLLAFINDPAATVDKEKWFDFTDLNFKFGTAEIIPESRAEVDNISKILKAYPRVKIKLGGYTDKVGDEAANKKLSQERANAVADALKAAGVSGQVTGAEGYGSAFAKFPADAPESDRIKDRHVSVSVREK